MSCGDTALIEVSPTSSACGTGTGTATVLQTCPSQCSTSGRTNSSPCFPTAQTSVGDRATTALSELTGSGFGLGTTCQALPFQCSTRVAVLGPDCREPTAQALVDESVATPRSAAPEPTGPDGTRRQVCPSKCAVSGAPGTARTPTAQTSFADPALTAASRPETDRSAGTSTACQAPVPVWWRMNGRPERSGAMSTPTAQKFVGLTAVTPASAAPFGGFGLGTTCQPLGAAVNAPAAGAIAATATKAAPDSNTL